MRMDFCRRICCLSPHALIQKFMLMKRINIGMRPEKNAKFPSAILSDSALLRRKAPPEVQTMKKQGDAQRRPLAPCLRGCGMGRSNFLADCDAFVLLSGAVGTARQSGSAGGARAPWMAAQKKRPSERENPDVRRLSGF